VPTQASDIITRALNSLLIFDQGRSDIGNDDLETLAVLNQEVARLYLAASDPPARRIERDDYFTEATAIVLAGGVGTLPTLLRLPLLLAPDGRRVRFVSEAAKATGVPDLPPAVRLSGTTITSLGRTGDPGAAETLTCKYTPNPGPLTARTHDVGALTPTDPNTSKWPSQVGDDVLVWRLARYWGLKSTDLQPPDLQLVQDYADTAEGRFFALTRGAV
ncbi:MAG: hypothetical protein OER21_16595, partial [Gemmatimonadota bacterium]|nr:hypothetical protein [Gemmatimonadota bacterium]